MLLALPFVTTGEASLASRKFLRGNSILLPGGDRVARTMGQPSADVAKAMAKVEALSVRARIVAEVLIGLLEMDDRSYLGVNRSWMPDTRDDTIGRMRASVNSSAV